MLSLWRSRLTPPPSLLLSLSLSPEAHGRHMRKLSFVWEADLTWWTDVVQISFWRGWEGRKASGHGGELQCWPLTWLLQPNLASYSFPLLNFQISHGFETLYGPNKSSMWHLVLSPSSLTSRSSISYILKENPSGKGKKDYPILSLINTPCAFRIFFLILSSKTFLLSSSHQHGCSSHLQPAASDPTNSPNSH